MMLLHSRTTPAVARTGPHVFSVICVPVAKIRRAMRGRAPVGEQGGGEGAELEEARGERADDRTEDQRDRA